MKDNMIRTPARPGDILYNGMAIELPPMLVAWKPEEDFVVVNLGAGNSPIGGADNLDRPEWEAPELPYEDESVHIVHAYHFLEHLDAVTMHEQMREIERVLAPVGVVNLCVPHASGLMAYQDSDHKTFYTEDTWTKLFDNPYYDTSKGEERPWQLTVHWNLIAAVRMDNLAIFTQLCKRSGEAS